MNKPKDRIEIASDVSTRDGIGVEMYKNDEIIIEIFRDDTKCTRTITVFKEDIPLDVMEECIAVFKEEIPWNFINYDELFNNQE